MKTRTTVALAVGGGYLLGRTKRLKLAMTVAGLAAGRRLAGPDGLMSRGLQTLRSAPEFEGVRDQVQEHLVSAGRSAALTTASNALGRITTRVNNGSADGASKTDDDDASKSDDDDEETSEGRGEPDDIYDEPEDASGDDDGDDQADAGRAQESGSEDRSPRKRSSGRSSTRKSTSKPSKASAGSRSGGDHG